MFIIIALVIVMVAVVIIILKTISSKIKPPETELQNVQSPEEDVILGTGIKEPPVLEEEIPPPPLPPPPPIL
jgi:hypothetical protein